MANDNRPIKRSRQLTPLSRDHHEGLLLVWKIKQGIANGTDKELIARYIRWFWEHDLENHFREEEELLAPYLKEEPMIKRMFDEHRQLRKMKDDEQLWNVENLNSFGSLLNDHIRFEERELFPLAETMIKEEDLDRIESELLKERPKAGQWEEEFWLKKK